MEHKLRELASVVSKAWADPEFEKALLKDPIATLAKENITVPKGVKLHVLKDTHQDKHLVIPVKPTEEVEEDVLDKIAGGDCGPTASTSW